MTFINYFCTLVFAESDQRAFFRRLYRSSLSFCIRGLEAIIQQRINVDGKKEKQEDEVDNPCQSLDVCFKTKMMIAQFYIFIYI